MEFSPRKCHFPQGTNFAQVLGDFQKKSGRVAFQIQRSLNYHLLYIYIPLNCKRVTVYVCIYIYIHVYV